MNLLMAYAKIPMSFLNLYRRKRRQATYTLAIAFAMSGILVINVWSLLTLASLIDRGWLNERRRIGPGEFVALLLGVLLAELVFVKFVQNRAAQDATFAARVGDAHPSISVWYAGISAVLLAVSTALVIV